MAIDTEVQAAIQKVDDRVKALEGAAAAGVATVATDAKADLAKVHSTVAAGVATAQALEFRVQHWIVTYWPEALMALGFGLAVGFLVGQHAH